MIEAVLDELDGITALDDIVILVATGTHRGNTEAELRRHARRRGRRAVTGSVNHDARDPGSLTWSARSAPACRSG